jgi:hypothetical protein
VQIAIRVIFSIQRQEIAGVIHSCDEAVIFGIAAITPVHILRLRLHSDGIYPFLEGR